MNSLRNSLGFIVKSQNLFNTTKLTRNFSSLKLNLSVNQWNKNLICRLLSTQEITRNLKLITAEPRKIEKNDKTLQLVQDCDDDKPLVVIFSWLQSKHKHLMKYAQLYVDQGFDVMVTQVSVWEVLRPEKGLQLVAKDVVKFLSNNDYYRQITLHGFSVGGFLFGECLVHMNKDMKKYQDTVDRVVAQIWDSVVDIEEITYGASRTFIPNYPRLHDPLMNTLNLYLKIFDKSVHQHYIRSSRMFHTNFIHAPALFYVSKTDLIGAISSNQKVAEMWAKKGVDVTWKCFEDSPHVMHFMNHRDEYIQLLFDHLASVDMIKYPEKIRARI